MRASARRAARVRVRGLGEDRDECIGADRRVLWPRGDVVGVRNRLFEPPDGHAVMYGIADPQRAGVSSTNS